MSSNRLYVLTRADLSKGQQAVQAGHAVAEWVLRNPQAWQNEFLIYLKVPSEDHLHEWSIKLQEKGHPYIVFREPDLENQVTALATVSDGKFFSNLPLMK